MQVIDLFLSFIIYSFLGWCMEMVVTNIHRREIVNRGFLLGPICPIYGYGSILIILLLHRFTKNVFLLFLMSMIVCSILEYFTSYFMEKLFHARWWDYSNKKWNLNGRICVNTMIPFGLLGVFMLYFLNPFVGHLLLFIPKKIRLVLCIVLFLIYVLDNVISFVILFGIRNTILKVSLDNTEEITKRVREIIKSKSYFSRREVNAFPNLKTIIKKAKEKVR